jgi:dTMP kinase
MAGKGLFLAIEGVDGSGKATQVAKLKDKLEQQGYQVEVVDFPRYKEESSYYVRAYLAGEYGTAEELGPFTPSLFYALDRYDASAGIRQALSENKIVIADRFTASNMAHQGQKFNNLEEKKQYWDWLERLEFEMLGIPRPAINIVLTIPTELSLELIKNRAQKDASRQSADIHEADDNHIRRARDSFIELINWKPDFFNRIDCSRSGKLMGVDEIANLIWNKVEPLLPADKAALTTKLNQINTNPYVEKVDGKTKITKQGLKYLESSITNVNGDVYTFWPNKLSGQTVAAAMARLSRRADDMRITILDEFTEKSGKDEDLLRRVITQYGDDSVQQLAGIHMVIENVSSLVSKKIEWGRLASYLEQSSRYLYFNQKDDEGNYRYHVPDNLDRNTRLEYKNKLDQIFDIYSDLVVKMTEYVRANSKEEKHDGAWRAATKAQACDAIRYLLPVATKSTVGIFASGQALESLITHLLSDDLLEAREVGQKILDESRKTIPTFLERVDKPERGGAMQAYLSETRNNTKKELLSLGFEQNQSDFEEPSVAKLVDYYPKNELDVLPHIIHELTNISHKDAAARLNSLDYNSKLKIFNSYVGERLNRRQKPGRAMEAVNYSWDVVCDYGIFRDLQRHRMVNCLTWQNLNPFLGYDTPELVQSAGLEDEYKACFELSKKLYLSLVDNGYKTEAQYATLLGHRMRWQISMNARQAFHFNELRTTPHGHPGYRRLVKQMHASMSEVHPNISAAMKFVNQDEDPVLTRLAAERASQWNMQQLKFDKN